MRMCCQVCGKFNHVMKDCFILQCRVMAEVKISHGASLGAVAEKEPVLRESMDMSQNEKIVNKMIRRRDIRRMDWKGQCRGGNDDDGIMSHNGGGD